LVTVTKIQNYHNLAPNISNTSMLAGYTASGIWLTNQIELCLS